MNRMRFKAVLLDFYGTVVEEADRYVAEICSKISCSSEQSAASVEIAEHWFKIVPEMCYRAYKAQFRLQNDIAVESLQAVLQRYQCNLDCTALLEPIREYWENPKIFPESKSVLARCNLPICLVSNTDDEYLYRAMRKHHLSFAHVVTSESCKSYKPRVDIFIRALSVLGASNKEVLVVGDSYANDVVGARAASIPVLWINRKNRVLGKTDEGPDYVSSDLCGVLEYIA